MTGRRSGTLLRPRRVWLVPRWRGAPSECDGALTAGLRADRAGALLAPTRPRDRRSAEAGWVLLQTLPVCFQGRDATGSSGDGRGDGPQPWHRGAGDRRAHRAAGKRGDPETAHGKARARGFRAAEALSTGQVVTPVGSEATRVTAFT